MAHQGGSETVIVDTSHSPYARFQPVPMDRITLEDGFWQSRLQVINNTTIPSQFQLLESTGRLDNFRRVTGESERPYTGYVFNDSDVFKWLEAAAWMLVSGRGDHDKLNQMMDLIISLIRKAQDKNGYINTYFSLERCNERWTNIQTMHELYCAGHLIQAAIAHHRATGGEQLLDVAIQFADHIFDRFYPDRCTQTSGHPEIEMALVELSRLTRNDRYLRLAEKLLDRRGHMALGGLEYYVDHAPFRDLQRLAGHAVRAVYLCCGAADIVLETGETKLQDTLQRLWSNMINQQMYITGGLGARHDGEAFGKPYELPNSRAYAETCAGIASIMWSWRMLLRDGAARYADLIEWTFYNAVLPGISLDGKAYFYTNALKTDSSHRRQEWFDCACCPPNLSRVIAQFPGYMYSVSGEGIWLHQYSSSSAEIILHSGARVRLQQYTHYPWEGNVQLRIANPEPGSNDCERQPLGEFSVFLRIPGWLDQQIASLLINAVPFTHQAETGKYLEIHREWYAGDTVTIDFPMEVRYLESHPLVAENRGRIAITRGPLVYCMESADNPRLPEQGVAIDLSRQSEVEFDPSLLGGIVTLKNLVGTMEIDPKWNTQLYGPVEVPAVSPPASEIGAISIPYFAWANRSPGDMEIWHLYK